MCKVNHSFSKMSSYFILCESYNQNSLIKILQAILPISVYERGPSFAKWSNIRASMHCYLDL